MGDRQETIKGLCWVDSRATERQATAKHNRLGRAVRVIHTLGHSCSNTRSFSSTTNAGPIGTSQWVQDSVRSMCAAPMRSAGDTTSGTKGTNMRERMDQIHALLPAEVTAAYLAVRASLVSQDVGESEYMGLMVGVVVLLVGVNAWLCYAYRGCQGFRTQALYACGVVIWAINVDTPRFEDIRYLGQHIEIAAPAALVLYTFVSSISGSDLLQGRRVE